MTEPITPEMAQKMVIEQEFKQNLINRTKNYGRHENDDGTVSYSVTLSLEGSVNNVIRSKGNHKWGAQESARLYNLGREAWLKGDFESVADLFGVLV